MQSTRFMIVATAVAISASALGLGDKSKPVQGWQSDYANAKAIARKDGKPMLVVFR
jgi:hypothetical protein